MKITLELDPDETLAFRKAQIRFRAGDCPTSRRQIAQWLLYRACNAVATTTAWKFGHTLAFDARTETPEEDAVWKLLSHVERNGCVTGPEQESS